MSMRHPLLQAEADRLRESIPDAEQHWEGTAIVLVRNGWGLSWRGERQTLPSGSTPLALNEAAICGQGWTEAEVRAFQAATDAPVVYEFKVHD